MQIMWQNLTEDFWKTFSDRCRKRGVDNEWNQRDWRVIPIEERLALLDSLVYGFDILGKAITA